MQAQLYTVPSVTRELSNKVIIKNEKELIYKILEKVTDDELELAISSHVKSYTLINHQKYHDAIGSFFLRISNVKDFRELILNPILDVGPTLPNITFSKYENDMYRIKIKNTQPSIRNSLSNELSIKLSGLTSMVYFYTKKEMNLMTLGKVHRNSNSNISNKVRRSTYLDVSNLINVIKFLKEHKIYDCLRPLISFSKELLSSAISDDDGPSECLEVPPSIAIGRNHRVSDRLIVISSFPYFPFVQDSVKLKCLISHYKQLSEQVAPNNYLNN